MFSTPAATDDVASIAIQNKTVLLVQLKAVVRCKAASSMVCMKITLIEAMAISKRD